MKFRVRFFETKWNGRRASTGKQIKQKTFFADGWDAAEEIAHKLWMDYTDAEMSLSVVK